MEAYVIKWGTRWRNWEDGYSAALSKARWFRTLERAELYRLAGETVHKVEVSQVTKIELLKEDAS